MMPAFGIPASLLRGFFRVDTALLVERYNAALASLGLPATDRERFHVDAAGYSPEIADDREDPLYLTPGVLHAQGVILAVEQLRAPLVHPGLGFVAEGFRAAASEATAEIGRITLREPLIVETRDPSTHLSAARHLADLSHVELHFRTPGGLLRGAERLEAMKQEFLDSERLWLDDEFIGAMARLAGEVRDLGVLPPAFAGQSHALGPFYAAAFGGSYVLEEPGASARNAVTHILCRDASASTDSAEQRSARGRRVSLETISPAAVASLLESHGIVELDTEALRARPELLDDLEHWIAVDHQLERDPGALLDELAPRGVVERMRGAGELPEEAVELHEVRRRIRAGRVALDPGALSPLLRARLLQPTSSREAVRRFTRHLRAFVDPVQLSRAWRHAPDVFFTRLPGLDAARRAYFAAWLERR